MKYIALIRHAPTAGNEIGASVHLGCPEHFKHLVDRASGMDENHFVFFLWAKRCKVIPEKRFLVLAPFA